MKLLRRVLLAAGLAMPAAAISQADLDAALEDAAASSPAVSDLRSLAASQPPATSDPQLLSVFYHRRGRAFQRLGEYERAVEDLKLALHNNQDNRLTTNDVGSRNRITFDLGHSIQQSGDWPGAIAFWRERLAAVQPRSYPLRHSYSLELSDALSVYGSFKDAGDALKQADEALRDARNLRGWLNIADAHLYMNTRAHASYESRRGNLVDAERLYRQALGHAEANLRARQKLDAEHLQLRGARDQVAAAKLNLAAFLSTRGKAGEAEFFARSGVEDRLRGFAFTTLPVAGSLSALGWTMLQQGNVNAARKYYSYAVKAVEGAAVPQWSTAMAAHRASLANSFLVQSRWQEALDLYERREQALRSNPEQYKRFRRTPQGMALALAKVGRADEALKLAQERLNANLKGGIQNQYGIALWRGVLGVAQSRLGRNKAAAEQFRLAIPELAKRESEDGESSGYFATFWQREILEAYIELLAREHAASKDPAAREALADEAFRLADVARGSGVQDAISGSAARASLPDPALAALARNDQDAKNRIEGLYQVMARLAASPDGKRPDKVIADMRADIERLRKDRAVFASQMRSRFPEYAELVDPRPVGIAQAWEVLAPGEALAAIFVGEKESYVWTMASDGRRQFHVAPVARKAIDADVTTLRAAFEFDGGDLGRLRAFDLAASHRLYQSLLAPGAELWEKASVLNIIPHGSLAQLPAALLVTRPGTQQPPAGVPAQYKDVPWLISRIALTQLPSASAFVALKRTPESKTRRRPFVGFGDPVFSGASLAPGTGGMRNLKVAAAPDETEQSINTPVSSLKPERPAAPPLAAAFALLSALPDTADELRDIGELLKADMGADLFLGQRATEGNVKRAVLSDRRVVAFATHGLRAGEISGLDQPALVLSNPALSADKDNDGFLTMEEVLGLKLDADWVILSACNTASGGVEEGEAVSGLGRAFFYAGARSLLVSNWAVESSSARLLTTELFKRQSDNPAMTRAEALRGSMLDLMSKEGSVGGAAFSYAHPLFWAPFSLVGDSGVRRPN